MMFAMIYTTNILYTLIQMQTTLLTLQQDLQTYQLTWPEGYTFRNGRLYYFGLTSPESKVKGEEQCFNHNRDTVWSIREEDELNWIFQQGTEKTAIWIPFKIDTRYNAATDSDGHFIVKATRVKESIEWASTKPQIPTDCIQLSKVSDTQFELKTEVCTTPHHTVCTQKTKRKYAITYEEEVERAIEIARVQTSDLLTRLKEKEKETRLFKTTIPMRQSAGFEYLNQTTPKVHTYTTTMDPTLSKQALKLTTNIGQIKQKLTKNIDEATILIYSNILTTRMNRFLRRITEVLEQPQKMEDGDKQYLHYQIFNNNLETDSLELWIIYANETETEEETSLESFYEITLIDLLLAVVSSVALVITLLKFCHVYKQKQKHKINTVKGVSKSFNDCSLGGQEKKRTAKSEDSYGYAMVPKDPESNFYCSVNSLNLEDQLQEPLTMTHAQLTKIQIHQALFHREQRPYCDRPFASEGAESYHNTPSPTNSIQGNDDDKDNIQNDSIQMSSHKKGAAKRVSISVSDQITTF